MAIYRLISSGAFGPDVIAAMSAAYEDTLQALDLRDRADPLTELVAHRIMIFVQQGELDPATLRDQVVKSFRE